MDDGTRTHDDRNHNPGLYQLSYAHHYATKSLWRLSVPDPNFGYGAPGRTRTCNPRLRRPMLYPVELRAHRCRLNIRASATAEEWSGQTDSNRRPSAPKADALPDCAMPRLTSEACARRGPKTSACQLGQDRGFYGGAFVASISGLKLLLSRRRATIRPALAS